MTQQVNEDLVKSSYVLMMGYLISSLISTIGTVVIIRLISVEEYSLLNISYIIPSILITSGEMGLNYASTHFIARKIKENNFKEIRNVIRIILIVKCFVGLVFSILIFLYATYIAVVIYNINDERLIFLIQIGAIGILSRILYDTLNSFYIGALHVKMVQMGTIILTSLRTFFSIFLVLLGFTYLGPMLGFIFSSLIVVFIYLICLRRFFFKDKIEREKIDWTTLSTMIKYGYPLLFLSIVAGIQISFYGYILTVSGYIVEVSYINVAIVTATAVGILQKSISLTIFPIFSKLEWNNDSQNERRKLIYNFKFSIKFSTLLIIPATILVILFSAELFPIIYGERYRDAIPFIVIFFGTFLFVSFGSLSIPAFFNGQKKTNYVFYLQLIELISLVVVSLILIPFLGAIGLVYGIVLGKLVNVIYGNALIRRKFGNILFKNSKNSYLICFMAIILGLFTFLLYNILEILIPIKNIIITILKMSIMLSFYLILFLILIGIFSLISVEELEYFEKSFKKFPIIGKILVLLVKVEKKIILKFNKKR